MMAGRIDAERADLNPPPQPADRAAAWIMCSSAITLIARYFSAGPQSPTWAAAWTTMSASASAAGSDSGSRQVALDELDRHAVERAAIRIAADHRLHVVAGLRRPPREAAAHHARSRR